MNAGEPEKAGREAGELVLVMREILGELKEINTSLKSIARSQANQTSVQKAMGSKVNPGGERR
jgi:hypothetical protein